MDNSPSVISVYVKYWIIGGYVEWVLEQMAGAAFLFGTDSEPNSVLFHELNAMKMRLKLAKY